MRLNLSCGLNQHSAVLTLLTCLPLLSAGASEPVSTQEAPSPPEQHVERALGAMGTWLHLEAWGAERWPALSATETALRAIEATEARLSTWIDDSEVSRFHAEAPGTRFQLSRETADELAAALRWRDSSAGAFEPACGAWIAEEAQGALSDLALHLEDRWLWRDNPRTRLATGGWGKGAGLDAALAALAERDERVRLDLGGQWARTDGAQPESVQLAHPDRRDAIAFEVTWAWASVATSGTSERGQHLLDPVTGAPAEDFGSVTVLVGPELERPCLAADALSTALFVLGPDRGLELVEELEHVEAVFLVRRAGDVHARCSSGLEATPVAPAATPPSTTSTPVNPRSTPQPDSR
jgi:thiamine biosynthesis lipoprotein